MVKHIVRGALIISVIWWLFPDICPGPIDDLIAVAVSAVSGATLLVTKIKEANALVVSDTAIQST